MSQLIFNLREINNQLVHENAELKEKLLNKDILLGKNFVKFGDSLYYRTFRFQQATIIHSQFKFTENHMLINKGLKMELELKWVLWELKEL